MKNLQRSGFYGWTNTIILSICSMITLGMVFYGFSVIFPVMVKSMGWSRGQASLAPSLRVVFMGISMPLAALFINRLGIRKSVILGLSILALALFLLATSMTKLWHWLVLWGVVTPFALSFYNLGNQTSITYWFNIRRATAMGVVMTGASLGGVIATPLFTWIIQQTGRWQSAWLVAGGFTLIALILSFWVRGKPADLGQYPDNINPDYTQATDAERKKRTRTFRTEDVWEIREIVRTPAIYYITVARIATSIPLNVLIVHMVLHLTDKGYTEMQAASVMAFITFFGSVSRIPVGWLGDRIEPRWLISGCLAVVFIMMYNVWKAPSFTVLIIGAIFYGLAYGGTLVLRPVIMGNY